MKRNLKNTNATHSKLRMLRAMEHRYRMLLGQATSDKLAEEWALRLHNTLAEIFKITNR